jgi:hypothetical protein
MDSSKHVGYIIEPSRKIRPKTNIMVKIHKRTHSLRNINYTTLSADSTFGPAYPHTRFYNNVGNSYVLHKVKLTQQPFVNFKMPTKTATQHRYPCDWLLQALYSKALESIDEEDESDPPYLLWSDTDKHILKGVTGAIFCAMLKLSGANDNDKIVLEADSSDPRPRHVLGLYDFYRRFSFSLIEFNNYSANDYIAADVPIPMESTVGNVKSACTTMVTDLIHSDTVAIEFLKQ